MGFFIDINISIQYCTFGFGMAFPTLDVGIFYQSSTNSVVDISIYHEISDIFRYQLILIYTQLSLLSAITFLKKGVS